MTLVRGHFLTNLNKILHFYKICQVMSLYHILAKSNERQKLQKVENDVIMASFLKQVLCASSTC